MKLINIVPIILLSLLSSPRLDAQDLANFSAAFVDIGFGARASGMGQAYSALAADANAALWNPAGIVEVEGFEATFSHTRLFNLIPYNSASMVCSFTPTFALGNGAIVSGDNLFQETSIFTSFATRFQLDQYRINMGLTLLLHTASFGKNDPTESAVQGDALGLALNLGFQFYLTEKIVIASHLQNLYNRLSWNTSTLGKYQEGLPRRWIVGIGFKDFHQLNFDLDIHKSLYRELEDQFFLGAERVLFKRAFLRAGTASSINQPQRLFYTFGGGINHYFQDKSYFQLDVAYVVHPLENTLWVSLSFRID